MLEKMTIEEVRKKIIDIQLNEDSYYVEREYFEQYAPKFEDFSSFGLTQTGNKFNFPASFVTELAEANHVDLANEIIKARLLDEMKEDKILFLRTFDKKIYGCLSDKQGIFDDCEVLRLIEGSPILMNCGEIWGSITPEQLHLRFINVKKIYKNGDSSPLTMSVYIDNSMIGKSSLRIRFVILRQNRTKEVITDLKNIEILREVYGRIEEV